jgi:hypothetical protein
VLVCLVAGVILLVRARRLGHFKRPFWVRSGR